MRGLNPGEDWEPTPKRDRSILEIVNEELEQRASAWIDRFYADCFNDGMTSNGSRQEKEND